MEPGIARQVARLAGSLALVLWLALAAAAAGATHRTANPGQAAARQALASAAEALAGVDSPGGARADVTLALRDLALAMPRLRGEDRRLATALLARPTDNPDPHGHSWHAPEAPASPHCSAHFCVHWVEAEPDAPSLADADGTSDGDGVPDYVERMAAIAEQSYAIENGALGWPPPRSDGALGGGSGQTDVYLVDVGFQGLFGYSAPDPPPAQRCERACFAYLVMDDDFSPAQFGYADPGIPLSVTMAHEYNHVLQFGIDPIQDLWMFEATAVWAEEKVFPDANDYLNYLPRLASTPGTPITEASGGRGNRIYAAAVWNHWLEAGAGYGPGVVLAAWRASKRTNPPDFAVAAYDRAIDAAGGRGFAREFVRFAAATAEWRTVGFGFPDAGAYPDVRRKGTLRRRPRPLRFQLDHTAYRLFDVDAGRRRVKLRVRAERGVRAGLALVGRQGDELTGPVTVAARFLRKGGSGSVVLDSPDRFTRLTAVVVNADGRVRGFGRTDWLYTRNNARFAVRLSR
jgi:hypothetical protein